MSNMDLLDKLNSLTDDQLRLVAERDDVTGVLAAYRLAELRGLPAPERSAAIMGDGYVIVARNGKIVRVPFDHVSKVIRQESGQYCVYSEDGDRAFGCYDTMEEAEDRLRQIHSFSNAEGRFVKLPDGKVGRIWHVMYDGVAEIPAGPTIQATPTQPAALVVVYIETDEGWVETPIVSGAPLVDLEMIEPLAKAKVNVGDHVLYAVPKPPDSTEYAHGIVDRIEREGTVTLPGTSESIEATSDDPVAVITVWAETNSGWVETDRKVVKPFSALRVSEEPLEKASAKVMDTLRQKVEDHNEDVGDNSAKRTNLRTLEAVFDRGVGAYETNPSSVRPNVTSAEQWAFGRVNGFLHALRTGRFKRTPFDTDLLPKDHPLSTKKEQSFKPPKGVQEAAQRALEWIGEGLAGANFTDVGRARAAQLARGDNVSERTIRRMRSFLARHGVNRNKPGWNAGDEDFPSAGRVAWDAWGGDPAVSWTETIAERLDRQEENKQYDPENALNPRQNMMYEKYEWIAETLGPWNGSTGPDGAHYIPATDNVFADQGMKCANCVFFEGGGGCEILDQAVEPEAVCKLWIIPENQVKESLKRLSKDSSFLRKQAARRFTLGPLYVPDFMDAHGEWTDSEELQQAVWEWVRSGDRTIYLQHDREVRAGEWVEVMTMPQPWTVDMLDGAGNAVGKITYPAGTVFLGVIWDDAAWQQILRGELRGYSIGGFSDRVLADLPDNGSRDGIELPQDEPSLAKSIADAVALAMKQTQPVVNVVMPEPGKAKIRRIERDEHGNIARIIEEDE